MYPGDFFYERLRQQIIDSYADQQEGNCASRKNTHLFLLFRYYESKRFSGLKGKALRGERDKFLNELQDMLNRNC